MTLGPWRIVVCGDGRSPHTQRWANAFQERGHAVSVVWRCDQFVGADLSRYDASVDHHAVGDELDPRRPWKEVVAVRQARALAKRLRPDIVHGLYIRHHGWTARDFGARPLVLSALGTDAMQLGAPQPRGRRARYVQRYIDARSLAAIRAADVVLCDSTGVASRLDGLVPGLKTAVVRFGADSPAASDDGWRARLGLTPESFVVLSTRLFSPNYNIDVVINAFQRVLATVPNAILVLKEFESFSDADYRAACLALIETLGLGASVRVVGELEQPQLRALYAAADVYVTVPSTDASAVSVFEAMAARVPVVASRAAGIDPSVLRDGETALLVEPRDVNAVAAAVIQLAERPEVRRRLAEGGHTVYAEVGSASAQFDHAERIYAELIARLRPGA